MRSTSYKRYNKENCRERGLGPQKTDEYKRLECTQDQGVAAGNASNKVQVMLSKQEEEGGGGGGGSGSLLTAALSV